MPISSTPGSSALFRPAHPLHTLRRHRVTRYMLMQLRIAWTVQFQLGMKAGGMRPHISRTVSPVSSKDGSGTCRNGTIIAFNPNVAPTSISCSTDSNHYTHQHQIQSNQEHEGTNYLSQISNTAGHTFTSCNIDGKALRIQEKMHHIVNLQILYTAASSAFILIHPRFRK